MKRPLLKRIRGGWVDPNTGTVPDPAEILSGDDQEPVEVSGLPRADSLEVTTGTRVAPVESSFQRTGISFLPTASAADAQEALRASGASGRKPRDGRRGSFGSFFSGSQNVRPASHTDHSAPTTSAVSEAVNPRGPLNPAKTVSSTYPVDRPRESGRTATNSDDPTSPNPVQGSGNGPTLAAVVASVDEEIAKELVQIVPDTQTTEILAPDLHDDAVDAAKSTEIRAAARGSNFDLGDTPLAREITD